MKPARSTLTVTFEAPFWIGLYEREEEGLYQVCKITFGAEPKEYEVYDFLLSHWRDLSFSPPIPAEDRALSKPNPKRLQREIKKQLRAPATSTKAQQAIQLQREQRAQAHKARARQHKAEEQARQHALRREKHKEKHRGR